MPAMPELLPAIPWVLAIGVIGYLLWQYLLGDLR